jgi:hypothetical protein
MRSMRSILWGLLIAIISSVIILGSLSLAMLEGNLGIQSPTELAPTLTSIIPTRLLFLVKPP